jgi:hypothetical protein
MTAWKWFEYVHNHFKFNAYFDLFLFIMSYEINGLTLAGTLATKDIVIWLVMESRNTI